MFDLNDLIKRDASHDKHVLHHLRHKTGQNLRVINKLLDVGG